MLGFVPRGRSRKRLDEFAEFASVLPIPKGQARLIVAGISLPPERQLL